MTPRVKSPPSVALISSWMETDYARLVNTWQRFNENTRQNSQRKRAATFALCRRLALCSDALVPHEQFTADVACFWTVSHWRWSEQTHPMRHTAHVPTHRSHIKGIFTRCPHSGLWLKSNGFSFKNFCSLSPRGYKMEWSGWVCFFFLPHIDVGIVFNNFSQTTKDPWSKRSYKVHVPNGFIKSKHERLFYTIFFVCLLFLKVIFIKKFNYTVSEMNWNLKKFCKIVTFN